MNIKKVLIESIQGAEYNPRLDLKPGMDEYENLKKSIETFGYVEPVIVNKRTNNIVGGHQRFKVLKDLGYTEIDIIEVDLDDNNEKALNVALNKISGNWDIGKLSELLQELKIEDFDLSLTGFSAEEFDRMLGDLELDVEGLDEVFRDLTQAEQEKRETPFMKFGKHKVAITQDELEALESQYSQYKDSRGSDVGFVGNMIYRDSYTGE